MVKIYTKTGDAGTTSLFGGRRVSKSSARIDAYGAVDELNSQIGVVLAEFSYSSSEAQRSREDPKEGNSPQGRIIDKLIRIQNELFVLGSDLSTPLDVKVKIPRISKAYIVRLEKEIDQMEKDLPKIKNFILPGGSKIGAGLHLARTIARRAERLIVELAESEKINIHAQKYINRLSDWLFVLARYANQQEKIIETYWRGRKFRLTR